MKQIFILSILTAIAVSCSSDEEREADNSSVEIKLVTGFSELQTLLGLLKKLYLIKPQSDNFLPGLIYQIKL